MTAPEPLVLVVEDEPQMRRRARGGQGLPGVYMAQLRRKIEVEPARPPLLQTEPGVGYRMREATT